MCVCVCVCVCVLHLSPLFFFFFLSFFFFWSGDDPDFLDCFSQVLTVRLLFVCHLNLHNSPHVLEWIEILFCFQELGSYLRYRHRHISRHRTGPISRFSQCSTTGVTKAVVCVILSVGWCI